MPPSSPSKALANPNHKLSLRSLLIIPFVLQIFAAVGLVGYFSFKNGQSSVNQLANQLIDKAGEQAKTHLDTYLALPQQLNHLKVFGHRQKHKGMSWRPQGSRALAILKVLELNDKWHQTWFPEHPI